MQTATSYDPTIAEDIKARVSHYYVKLELYECVNCEERLGECTPFSEEWHVTRQQLLIRLERLLSAAKEPCLVTHRYLLAHQLLNQAALDGKRQRITLQLVHKLLQQPQASLPFPHAPLSLPIEVFQETMLYHAEERYTLYSPATAQAARELISTFSLLRESIKTTTTGLSSHLSSLYTHFNQQLLHFTGLFLQEKLSKSLISTLQSRAYNKLNDLGEVSYPSQIWI